MSHISSKYLTDRTSFAGLPDHVLEKMAASERRRLGKSGRTMREIADKATRDAEKELHKQIVAWLEQHSGRNIKVGHARMDKPSTFTKGCQRMS